VGDAAPKSGRCVEHSEQPWVRSTRSTSDGWSKARAAVLRRDRRRCVFCGQESKTVDHRLPTAWGGSDELDNLQTMCRDDHRVKTGEESRLGRRLKDGSAGDEDVARHVLRWTPDLSLWGRT
jgi:5-methylcytosine-specific restriction protein A